MGDKSVCISKKGVLTRSMPNALGLMFFICLVSLPCISFHLQKVFSFKKKGIFVVPQARKYLDLISPGLKSIFADVFYVKGVLAVTDRFDDPRQSTAWVQDNFGAAISLDPKFTEGYFFGGIVVADNKEGTKKGIEFLEKYRYLNPSDWRILYWTGFNYYQLEDYITAANLYHQASEMPGAPPFLKSNQAMFYYRADKADLGVMYLEGLLNSVKDPHQLEWIKTKLEWLKNIIFLKKKAEEFETIYGKLPDSLDDLVKEGVILEVPSDPFGKGYYWDKETDRVKSKFFEESVGKNITDEIDNKSSKCSRCAQ